MEGEGQRQNFVGIKFYWGFGLFYWGFGQNYVGKIDIAGVRFPRNIEGPQFEGCFCIINIIIIYFYNIKLKMSKRSYEIM